MTPFDMLFVAVIVALVLILAVELWHVRMHQPPPDDDLEPWIQVWPPDDR